MRLALHSAFRALPTSFVRLRATVQARSADRPCGSGCVKLAERPSRMEVLVAAACASLGRPRLVLDEAGSGKGSDVGEGEGQVLWGAGRTRGAQPP